jgi:hypothetical protein
MRSKREFSKDAISSTKLCTVLANVFYSAKTLYSNLKYLSKNNIQDLEIKNQKIPISFENRKLVGILRRESSDNS